MHPYVRLLVGAVVVAIVAGALVALAFAGRDVTLSLLSLLGAGVLGVLVGGLVFVQSWRWSQRFWRQGTSGRALAAALVGGFAVVLAAGALAATTILVLTFVVG